MLNIAFPKGRLGERVRELFSKAGYKFEGLENPERKLIFYNAQNDMRCFRVKPFDVSVYVERGAADIGVAGRDILLERDPDVYELMDLKTGLCKMAVAALNDFRDDPEKVLRVATEFPEIAKKYYAGLGRDIDIIYLRGSVEIAPVLGLSDVIVDIVETGSTLKANNLKIVSVISELSARLIANKSAYKFKGEIINQIMKGLSQVS